MARDTPFFKGFSRRLFGRPPVAALAALKRLRSEADALCLSGLEAVFGSFVAGHLLVKRSGGRDCVFTTAVTFWAFLSQVLDPGSSCAKAVGRLGALFAAAGLPVPSGATGSYCVARAKLPLRVLLGVLDHVSGKLVAGGGGRTFLVDGTGLSMPDTVANQGAWPQRRDQKLGCGFPLMKLVGLFDLESGAWVGSVRSRFNRHDIRMLRGLYKHLRAGDTVVADRGFCSYWTVAELMGRGVDVVMRNHQMRKSDFRKGARLGKRDHVIVWEKPVQKPRWMDEETYAAMPAEIVLRETDIGVPCEGYRTKKIVVVSTFLNVGEKTKEELAEIYRKRWRVELFFDDIKTTLGMDVMRTKSPGMVCREILVHMIAYNLVRCLVARSGGHPERTSFKGACDRANVWAPFLMALPPGKRREAAVGELLDAVASGRVPERLGRCEPRVKKRRPKTYQLLTKPRHEMVEQMHRGKRRKTA